MSQFHFDPATYSTLIREDIARYDELQEETARATEGVETAAILELGTGTGETARRVLALHPGARLVGIDEAVHHLDVAGKRDLFARVAAVLAPGGRFVLADVIVPYDPADALIPLSAGFDLPDSLDDQLGWLAAAGFESRASWVGGDLAVIAADSQARA
ncbi:MAG TPA: class I SAM-dependent methyltransferase [Gaiellaceae bacterium]|nr:class I SAM-dependent methyltransferase [Gaiellaceae bacterium]